MKNLLFLFISIFLLSCNKTDNQNDTFNAKVLHTGLDCGNSCLIKFYDGVNNVPANSTDNIFYEINLPEQYKINGLDINVNFRTPNNDELMGCTTMDITYPQIFIINVD